MKSLWEKHVAKRIFFDTVKVTTKQHQKQDKLEIKVRTVGYISRTIPPRVYRNIWPNHPILSRYLIFYWGNKVCRKIYNINEIYNNIWHNSTIVWNLCKIKCKINLSLNLKNNLNNINIYCLNFKVCDLGKYSILT